MPRAQQLPAAFGVNGSTPQPEGASPTINSARRRRLRPCRRLWVLGAAVVFVAACGGASNSNGANALGTPPERDTHAMLLSTQPVATVPTTIDDTGATDVTSALQSFIDQTDNGTDIRFQRDASYRIEGTLFVTNKTLTFDGEGSTFFATTRGTLERSLWWISSGGGIIFRNLTVRGANPYNGLSDKAYNPALAKQHGFRIEGVDGIELDHVTVTNVYGDFVYIARYAVIPSTNVWIHDSTFISSGRQGISLIATEGVIIERNRFSEIRRGTIDLEPNGPNQNATNIFVLNNLIGSGRLLFVASHGKGPVDGIVISGNRLHGHALTIDDVPPKGQRRANWIITNNTSDTTSGQRPIRFVNTDGLLVTGNTQRVPATVASVELDNDCGAQISKNILGQRK
jgi:hypothetical protein